MQETDDHGGNIEVTQGRADLAQIILVERGDHGAGMVAPLRHLEAQVARDQRDMRAFQAVHRRPVAPPELQHVTETARRDQGGPRATAFDHGVGGNGGAMHDGIELTGREVGGCERGQQSVGRISRGGGYFQDPVRARAVTREEQVRKGAADIDADHCRR